MGKKVASIIGIVFGVAIIIIGVSVMNPETYTVGDPFMKFGADFYTEIYDVTRDVGGAVQRGYKNICNAIGWLIVVFGLFDIAYFSYKMVSCNDDGARNTHYVASPTTTPRDTTQIKEILQPIPTKPDTPPVVQGRSPSVETSPSLRKVYAEGEFIPGRSYSYGDEVIFENKRYVCVSPSATVWNPSQFPAQWKGLDDSDD